MSYIITGKQNQIDLSWNHPINNGYAINNSFFYNEENANTATPIISYYSYQLPLPNIGNFLSFSGTNDGFDVNTESTSYTLLLNSGFSNFFDLLYGGEIQLSWEYHSDLPIIDICNNFVYQTTMNLSIIKTDINSNSIALIESVSRTYDTYTNKLGPIPINNGKRIKDIFAMTLDPNARTEYKKFNKSDIITVSISLSSLSYIPFNANSVNDTRRYSIIIKDILIAPYRLPFSQSFTSLSFGDGNNNGFVINKTNALANIYGNNGAIYYMPRLTNEMKTTNTSNIQFSWMYNFDLSLSNTQLNTIGISDISNIQLPYRLRIRGYTRSFIKTSESISTANYNTANSSKFIYNASDVSYNTIALFDYDISYVATYSDIIKTNNIRPSITKSFNIPSTVFPSHTDINDKNHNQFVFIFSLHFDTSLPVYSDLSNNIYNNFNLSFLSYTYTPHQYYKFSGPDPTINNALTNTAYNFSDPYTNIRSFYSFYNLTNGIYYAYKIASNNFFGTSQFSNKSMVRCGSRPNQIYSSLYSVESYNLRNQISIIWERPPFSGYEIIGYRVQYVLDLSGKWLNVFNFTYDRHPNDISFNMFNHNDILVALFDSGDPEYSYISRPTDINNVTSQIIYRYLLKRYSYLNSTIASQNYAINPIYNNSLTGNILNGVKYYIRLAAMNIINNVLQIGEYSPIYSGFPISYPSNTGINNLKTNVVGNDYIVFSWNSPINDGGGPILDYLIEYAASAVDANGNVIKVNGNSIPESTGFIQYYADSIQPKDKLLDYKYIWNNQYSNSSSIIATLEEKRANLLKYKIPPRPISLYDIDRYSASNTSDISFSRALILSNANTTYYYTSLPLSQNEFDLTDIQFAWYYIKDLSGGIPDTWTVNTKINLRLNINIYLTDLSNSNPIQLFTLRSTDMSYNVTSTLLSDPFDNNISFKFINYLNGSLIPRATYAADTPRNYVTDKTLIDSSFSDTVVNTEYIVYTYTSSPFTSTNIYLKNIQLKWYYVEDASSSLWDSNTNINFKISINCYITNSNGENKLQIFSLPLYNSNISYDVTSGMLSNNNTYKYIDFNTGRIIQNNNDPLIPIVKKYELDNTHRLRIEVSVNTLSNETGGQKFNIRFAPLVLVGTIYPLIRVNNKYKLHVDASVNTLTNGNGAKCRLYFSQLILNGSPPVRASSDVSTTFTYTLANNAISKVNTGKEYIFRIRPFNISDYFENIPTTNQFTEIIDSSFANPITNLSYILNYEDGSGGSVTFNWSYGVDAKYYILVTIPSEYENFSYPNEYLVNSTTEYSIYTEELNKSTSSSRVSFSIPSVLATDISGGRHQTRLRNGRAYNIQIAPTKNVISDNNIYVIKSAFTTVNYVIPFTIPLNPLSFAAKTGNNKFTLNWTLPNIVNDPNYYITENLNTNYYKYVLYVIEYKTSSVLLWSDSSVTQIVLPIPATDPPGTISNIDISNVINDTDGGSDYNVRIKLAIQNTNNTPAQYAYSNYTYLTTINGFNVSGSPANIIYASGYPTNMPPITNLNIWKISNTNNKIGLTWITPHFNGTSAFYYYEYQFSFTPDVSNSWIDVYDPISGIADQNSNSLFADPSVATVNIPVNFTLTCKTDILRYSIRVKIYGFNTLVSGLPNFHPVTARRSQSIWSNHATITL